ncbi:Bug family tripartite tricarboxylate transporter substrate binding protein [Diaphorobacter caeni]|uniref:Bug family tripartite tricarboxylate transporter substrate binding protein n=1 Tax=Diaphorobacter caeni TaxID=2784387 RepID=UPI0018903814|nr:tripartite tricarboxylate transporter substrate binding protein [Diaphorobacter caeni]MBF5002840.1 tripartite tricarboxylate transporter substrate binding protein [Diaphorobacter caeni]
MQRSAFLRLLKASTLAGALAVTGLASAQVPYPGAGTITLVVPFAAGSGTDAVARVVAQKLGERLKQSVIVDNRAGASAQIGAQFAAKAKPDGYTLFMTTNTSHSANPWLFKSLKYDPIKDFTPIARVGELPFALVVSPKLPVKSVQELLDYAKAHPDKLSYGTPNSTSEVALETIKFISRLQITKVPYKSSPQALTDLMGDQIQVYVADLGSSWSMIKSDRVRALGVTAAKGSSLLPNLPPIGKTIAGFDLTSWNGIFAPAHTPKEVVDRINAELQVILADKAVREQLAGVGFEVWPTKTPEEFAGYVNDQLAYWGKLIKQAGIEKE